MPSTATVDDLLQGLGERRLNRQLRQPWHCADAQVASHRRHHINRIDEALARLSPPATTKHRKTGRKAEHPLTPKAANLVPSKSVTTPSSNTKRRLHLVCLAQLESRRFRNDPAPHRRPGSRTQRCLKLADSRLNHKKGDTSMECAAAHASGLS